ncbi:hypothetical protein JG688_00003986 [Phytophthora aleatoria]|uniref:Trimethylguanosine synthase n=1 Tax=Phytophthora aleatoria TaxID=2496075 RepID=A0A8J5MHC7_9STRA|nr:hypothetical protein JG688_00003986 [Phytophthora aleatoria]
MMEQRAAASVRASMDFNGPLNALSTSPNNRLIAVGVLKVVALEPSGFTEKRNLRVVGKPSLNFSTNDIRWHPQSDYLLATAATNGAVVIWNLERDGYKHVQERVLNGHRRAVNRICWHTSDWNVLISGSQDGTVKLWDKRGGKVVSTYQPKSESVRDVRASPFHANKFAAAFENGIVQVWDMRKNSQPELKFTAHKGLVLSIDWHPTDANVLASGGRDRYVKIWELGDVRQPKQTIQTIASVGRVAWRPTCVTHIATSASLMDNSIHVWDTKRPFIPVASMKGHSDIASGISWMDTPVSPNFGQMEIPGDWEGHEYWQHMLACSKDGTLKLHSLADSFKPHQSLPTTALALNSKGQAAFSHDCIVALVTMQNVIKAHQLEKIFLGDESEYVQAGKQVEALRAQFEQGQYLKESFGFDEHTFRFLAKHYMLFPEVPSKNSNNNSSGDGDKGGVSFAQMCAHNALAAFVTGNSHLCQMWRILEVLYANEEADTAKTKRNGGKLKIGEQYAEGFSPEDGQDRDLDEENRERSPSNQVDNFVQRDDRQDSDEFGHDGHSHATHGHNNASETTMLLEQLDHVNPQAMEGFDPYPYDPTGRHANESGREAGDRNGTSGVTNVRGNSSMIMNGSAVMGDLGHLRDDVLKEVLEYYTEIGDLQSCVAITVVVGKVTSVEKVMGKAWLQHIYMHYIDLLHQLQIYTTANELVANCSDQSIRQMNMPGKGKKNKKNKRRRLTNGDAVEDGEDACADMYRAAQAQLEQEMKAAGMEGTLPMSFGGGASKKRKRSVEEEVEQFPDEEENGQVDGEEGNNAVDADLAEGEGGDGIIADGEEQVAGKETPKTETTIVDKIRVVYDSDGEVVERVVEKVEVVEEVKPQEQSISEIEHKNSTGKKKKNKYPVPKDVVKFYLQRHVLFEKFEDGIQLDHESWYSVTPQVIAEHLAKRLACDVVVDPFSGCGGNVIQLAMTCKQVIAIDIDPEKIRMAKHNAGIYGVADKIEFIVGNSIDILPRLKADAVFLSPPWGGVKYSRKRFSLEDMLVKGVSGLDLFAKARQVSKNIAYYLPRGTHTEDLEALTPGEPVECEKIFLNKQLKVVTAYYGDLVASEKQVEDLATSNGQKQE